MLRLIIDFVNSKWTLAAGPALTHGATRKSLYLRERELRGDIIVNLFPVEINRVFPLQKSSTQRSPGSARASWRAAAARARARGRAARCCAVETDYYVN